MFSSALVHFAELSEAYEVAIPESEIRKMLATVYLDREALAADESDLTMDCPDHEPDPIDELVERGRWQMSLDATAIHRYLDEHKYWAEARYKRYWGGKFVWPERGKRSMTS
jgi:hypothetical protein